MKSTRTFLICFFALTTIGALAFVYKQYLELISLRAQVEDPTSGIKKQLADDEAIIKKMRADLAAANARPRRVVASADEADAVIATAGPNDRRGRPQGFRGNIQKLFSDPEFQKLAAIQQKAQLDNRYAALFKILNLSPEQLDQFKNLLVQKQQSQTDALQAARAEGLNPRTDQQAFSQAVADAASTVDQQIKTALGDAAFNQYQQYDQTLPQRTVVSQLQQSLSYTSAPLSDEQTQQLVQLLAQNQPAATATGAGAGGPFFGNPVAGIFGGGGNTGATITPQAVAQAAAILSPAQLQALQQVQAQQQAQVQMRQLLRAGFGGPGTPGGGAGADGAGGGNPGG